MGLTRRVKIACGDQVPGNTSALGRNCEPRGLSLSIFPCSASERRLAGMFRELEDGIVVNGKAVMLAAFSGIPSVDDFFKERMEYDLKRMSVLASKTSVEK